MGGKQSKTQSYHQSSSNYGPPSFPTSSPYSTYPRNHVEPDIRSILQRKYTKIDDKYNSLEQVTEALSQAGLESSNLIVGIDFTKSNEWTGARSFNHRSLHYLGDSPNPYEQAISIIGRTLSAFDEDNLIPCFGFGDATTHDQEVFSFYPDDRSCNGFKEALFRYREIVPQLRLAGPTSFAPIIETAIGIVENSGGQYHVLLIIADGQFVNFTDIMSRNIPASKKETEFALAALMEIPSQYKATLDLHLLGCRRGTSGRTPLPPTARNYNSAIPSSKYSQSSSFKQSAEFDHHTASAPPAENPSHNQTCPLCSGSTKDLAFGCGHQTCYDCGRNLLFCPICRTHVSTRIRLY